MEIRVKSYDKDRVTARQEGKVEYTCMFINLLLT